MNFTREPIIETVIMPREGCKLLVRNSKGSQEEYYVDSIEVVSFGRSLFFRSQERPKSFLVPVSDYEILETKEIRVPLKNATPERSIKIGGGRESSMRPRDSSLELEPYESHEREHLERPLNERKRDKRRRGGRRGGGRPDMQEMHPSPLEEGSAPSSERSSPSFEHPESKNEEKHKAPSFISKLFPPPPTLIKDSLSRYKTAEIEEIEMFSSKEEKLEDTLFESPLPPDAPETDEEKPPFED